MVADGLAVAATAPDGLVEAAVSGVLTNGDGEEEVVGAEAGVALGFWGALIG